MARLRANRWQADIRYGSERLRPTFKSQHEAEVWEAEARLEIAKGKRPSLPVQVTHDLRMSNALDLTIRDHWQGAKSSRHLILRAREVLEVVGPNLRCHDVTYSHVRELISRSKAKGNSGATINRKLAAFSKIMRVAKRYDDSIKVPPMDRQMENAPREVVLSDDQIRALEGWPHWGAGERLLLQFLIDTGCRFSEACPQDDRHAKPVFDLVAGTVTFPDTKSPDGRKTSRTLPLTSRIREALSSGASFEGISYRTFKYRFDEAVAQLGLPKDTVIHTLRHTAATRLAAMGVDVFKLMKWMGHRSIKTTERYVKVNQGQLAEVAKLMERV